MRSRIILGAVAVCCAAGLSSPTAAWAQADAKAPAGLTAPAGKGPIVTLLEAGNGPKQKLRYKFVKGTAQTMTMSIDMSMKMSVGGQQMPASPLPTMRMTMNIETAEVLPNGDGKVAVEFADADVVEKPGVPPQVSQQMKQALQGTKGLKGTTTMSAQGEAKGASFDIPANAPPQVRQSVQQAEQQMSQMAAPLPDEAVGAGAKWEVASQVGSQGMTINQIATYTLKELAADGATFDVAIKQSAPPGQPAQGGAVVQKMESTGSGTIKMRFASLAPADASMTLAMAMVMGAPANGAAAGGGKPPQVTMDMTMAMTMTSADKK